MDKKFLSEHQGVGKIEKAEPRESWPLTYAERQMATEQYMNPDSVAYNVNIAHEITGALDIPKLEKALSVFVERHSAMRSYYPQKNGEFTHKVAKQVSLSIQIKTCASDEVEKLIQKNNTPYDLSQAPLFRFSLYQTGRDIGVLHCKIHHIIIDGVSISIMANEIWRLYNDEELPCAELDYTDYAAWQSEHSANEEGKEFFSKIFVDGVPENEMPSKPRRPDTLPFANMDYIRILDVKAIDEAAQKLGVTTFKLLFAATALTLAKYCGSEDVTLGTAMNGRDHGQTAGMVGRFVNVLPIRVKAPGRIMAKEYIRAVGASISEAKKHQTFPFEQLVPILAPDRNASRSPVFDIIVNYLPEIQYPNVPGLSIRELPIKRQALAVDIMLEFLREGDKMRAVMSYSRDLYQDEIIAGMMEQFAAILSRLPENGGQTALNDIAELPDKHRNQILIDFAGERSDENRGETLVSLFRKQAKKTPDGYAIVFKEKTLTYAELDTKSDRIAGYLAAKNKGGVVGILVNRSEMMPMGALSVMKSGGAYLPLDPSYPAERLEFMLEDAGAAVVLADEVLKDRIPGYKGEFLLTKDITGLPDGNLPSGPKPADTMILLYTSGTTGKPKGVMLSQANLVNFCTWYARHHNISRHDNIPAYASFGFDAHMMDAYPALISGACVHIIPEEMRLDLPALRDYFNDNGISVAFITTQLGRQFAESMSSSSLRVLSVGGETLVPVAPPKGYSFNNVYGPTECTVLITEFHVDKLYDRVPIGRALDNTALYVVDKHTRLAPVGTSGELCVAGRQVSMKGYLNRPDITEEKFVKNPFSDDPDYAVMYRTGDVVRFLPDGNIDFVGRRDFQVKIRGFRVELTEIEERIRAFPAVKDAAVVAADAPGGGKCAVAYIVGETAIEIEFLNKFIEQELPAYMVPSATMQIEKIPLNPNGKVDRRKLPNPEFSDAAGSENEVRPLNDLEAKIFDVAVKILGHERFGLTTSLLRAGLTSLSSIKLATAIDEKLGVAPSVHAIMKNPTLLGIENIIIGLLLAGKTQTQEKQKKRQDRYPLSQSQMGLYYECVKNPETVIYNIPVCFALDKDTDTGRLQKAVSEAINAHPALKTRLFLDGEVVWQRYTVDQTHTPEIIATAEADMPAIKSAFVRPFHLFDEPLIRISIYATEQKLYLMLDFHHIIFDGISLDIFMRELEKAYNGKSLEIESFTTFDAAQIEKEYENSEEYRIAKAFFDSLMKNGDGATEIPSDRKKTGKSGAPETVRTTVEKESLAASLAVLGVTPSSLFLGATVFATSRFANTKNIGIAAISNGRESPRLRNTIGMFVKTLPLVFNVESSATAATYLSYVQKTMYSAIMHEAYPYTKLASEYQYYPQILFAYQGSLGKGDGFNLGGKPVSTDMMSLDTVKFPIDISIEEDGKAYCVKIEYDPSLWDMSTMETYAGCIAYMARQFAANHENPLGNFSIADQAQIDLIKSFWGPAEKPLAQAIHHPFELWAEKTPDTLALTACDGDFTYRQLNERANRIAHALLEKGVKKGNKVAFLLSRTSHVFSAIYGIVKAGCAFIPIDPAYPRERIEHILIDSDAGYVLIEGENSYENGLDIAELLKHPNFDNPQIDVGADDLCYLIYTSGSTGKPKGVMLAHRGIVNYSTPFERNPECALLVKQSGVVLTTTTVSFDAFLYDIFAPLSNGLRTVFASDIETRNPMILAELCKKTSPDTLATTPSVIMQYMEVPEMRAVLEKFRLLIIGAEKFPETLYDSLREITSAVIFNSYGPTEATVDCNCKIVTEADKGIVPAGLPESGVKELIMDMDGNPLPCGVIGELWIGGAGVALGYNGAPELTAERFVDVNGERYYRSGDLAKWNANGEVVILGRNDSQIKLRGLRIELGEIENAIASYEGIKRVVVRVCKIRNQEHLCAYYTADAEIKAADLRAALSARLPKYMIPTAYRQMEAMPVTPNGKADVKALPEAELIAVNDYEPPKTETETVLCKIFSEALGLEKVGANDNFFDLGGTSLLVARVTVGAKNKNYDFTYADVFQCPTPRELAALLSGETTKAAAETGPMYDYAKINALLTGNSIKSWTKSQRKEIGNICLTGAVGFLGIHILREFIEKQKGAAYCVVRGGSISAQNRLKTLLAYYFEDSYEQLFGSRIFVIDGDILSNNLFAELDKYLIDTYINCAAIVKHFSEGTEIEDVNVTGVENAIKFCRKKGCRLIQVSTCSIAGYRVDGSPEKNVEIDERLLYFGQDLSNKYIHSKFIAERKVFEAVVDGLDAKIMRVGNLMARSVDGEFQANFNTNNFLGLLRAYHIIGKVPFDSLSDPIEFSPVDSTARALLMLCETPQQCTVFHPYNNNTVFFRDVINSLAESGIGIQPCEAHEWQAAYSETLKDKEKAKYLLSLFAYEARESHRIIEPISASNTYTVQALDRLGFIWPIVSHEYLSRFVEALKGLGFYEQR